MFKTKYNSTDYSYNKGENIRRWLTKDYLTTKHIYLTNERYRRETVNKFGKFKPGDRKIKECYDSVEKYESILQCWKGITDFERVTNHRDVLQVSSGVNHNRRDVCIIDIDADNWDNLYVSRVIKLLQPTYIIKTQSGHLQIGFVYNGPVSPRNNTITFSLGNQAVRHMAARQLLISNGQVYGDDNYTGWQCKNPYSKRVSQLHYDDECAYDYIDLQCKFRSVIETYKSIGYSVDTSRSDYRIGNATTASATVKAKKTHHNNKIMKKNNDSNNSRTIILYQALRTAITKIKNAKLKKGEEPTCSFEEAYEAAKAIAAMNTLGKGILSDNEIRATTRCTLKWVNANWRPFVTKSKYDEDQVEFGKLVRACQFLATHSKIVNEIRRRKKEDLPVTTRAIAEALDISHASVASHLRKTQKELDEYIKKAKKFKEACKSSVYADLLADISIYLSDYSSYKENSCSPNTLFLSLFNNSLLYIHKKYTSIDPPNGLPALNNHI